MTNLTYSSILNYGIMILIIQLFN